MLVDSFMFEVLIVGTPVVVVMDCSTHSFIIGITRSLNVYKLFGDMKISKLLGLQFIILYNNLSP